MAEVEGDPLLMGEAAEGGGGDARCAALEPSDGGLQTREALVGGQAQAGAAGRPVLGVRGSGAEDAISDGENGFLREAGDVEGLAAGLLRLVRDALAAAKKDQSAVDEFLMGSSELPR